MVNLENDNAVAEDPYFIVNVVEKVNHGYLRALPDFGNSVVQIRGGRKREGRGRDAEARLQHVPRKGRGAVRCR